MFIFCIKYELKEISFIFCNLLNKSLWKKFIFISCLKYAYVFELILELSLFMFIRYMWYTHTFVLRMRRWPWFRVTGFVEKTTEFDLRPEKKSVGVVTSDAGSWTRLAAISIFSFLVTLCHWLFSLQIQTLQTLQGSARWHDPQQILPR